MTTKTVNGVTKHIYSTEELISMVSTVLRLGRGVTPWEQNFMKDMERNSRFSEKQAEIIERIYAERT